MRKSLFFGLILPAVMLSCAKERPDVDQTGKGAIAITTQTDKGVDDIARTRAAETDSYWFTVTKGETVIAENTLGNQTVVSELNPGSYTVSVISDRDLAMPAFNKPVYQGAKTDYVGVGSPTKFQITASQMNTGIRFVFDESVRDYYRDGLRATITDNAAAAATLDYTTDNEENEDIAYFEAGSSLRISLKNGGAAVNIGNAAYKNIDVSAKELWTITLRTSHIYEGGVEMEIVVDEGTDDKNPDFGVGDVAGAGTPDSPYSVSDAVNSLPASGVWIEGYIVGSSAVMTPTTRAQTASNILIGTSATSVPGKCLILELPAGSELAAKLNLTDNDLVGRTIFLKGDIKGRSDTFSSDAAGVISEVSVDDVYTLDLHPSGNVLKDNSFPVGFSVHPHLLRTDPGYRRTVAREASSITAEYVMKMKPVWTDRTTYNYTEADYLVDFARENGIRVHGHTLIWNDANTPEWVLALEGALDGAEWETLMKEYITRVVTHFGDKVASWDVVNEAFDRDGSFVSNVWMRQIGQDYIKIAYQTAHEAAVAAGNPDCILLYNDFGMEDDGIVKREAIRDFIKGLQDDGVPVHGVGVQMHRNNPWSPSVIGMKDMMDDLRQCGYVHISELDIEVNMDPAGDETFLKYKDERHYNAYRRIVQGYIENTDPGQRFGLTTWGVDDGHSWVRVDAKKNDWPLMFNADYTPKGAYYGVLDGMFDTQHPSYDYAPENP